MPPKGWFLDGCRWRLAAQKVDVQADEVAAIDDVGDVDDAAIAVGDEAVDLGGRRVYRDVELAGDVGIGAADGRGLMGAGELDAGRERKSNRLNSSDYGAFRTPFSHGK